MLPALAGACALWLAARRATRPTALILSGVVLLQVALWLCFTHAKGRFLLPTVIPMALLTGLAFAPMATRGWLGRAALASLCALWCLQSLLAYATDGPLIDRRPTPAAAIGLEPLFMGESPEPSLPGALMALPKGSQVATLGAAAVYWWPIIPSYSTVWNDGVVSRAIADAGGDGAKAAASLASSGITHVVVDRTMLAIWRRSGWLNASITDAAVTSLESAMHKRGAFGSTALFELAPPTAPPTAPPAAPPLP